MPIFDMINVVQILGPLWYYRVSGPYSLAMSVAAIIFAVAIIIASIKLFGFVDDFYYSCILVRWKNSCKMCNLDIKRGTIRKIL